MLNCKRCQRELNDETWRPSDKNRGYHLCIICARESDEARRERDKIRKRNEYDASYRKHRDPNKDEKSCLRCGAPFKSKEDYRLCRKCRDYAENNSAYLEGY